MTIAMVFALSLAVGPVPAATQASGAPAGVDARWNAWLGCWQGDAGPRAEAGETPRVCIVDGRESGVRLLTVVGGRIATEEWLVADGATRTVAEGACTGTERAQWSRNQLRVFRRSELTCGSDVKRTVAGLSFLASGRTLVRVDVMDADGARGVRVQRLRRAADQSMPEGVTLAMAAADRIVTPPWSLEEVIELHAQLPPEGVQAALSEMHLGFPVNAGTLVALDDAGVDDNVIDLVVALANPRRFVVRRPSPGGGGGGGLAPWDLPSFGDSVMTNAGMSDWDDPLLWMYAPWGFPGWSYWSPAASRYGVYSGLYGISYYGWGSCSYGCGYPYGGGWTYVGGEGGQPGAPQSHGRVIKGSGYTQVAVREANPSAFGGSRGGGDGVSGAAGGGVAGSGGVSSQGYSGGAAAGAGDRTAQPR